MTDQRELDRVLAAFFVYGTDELADRVIDAALDQIDHTPQRHALRLPRRLQAMPIIARLAVAAAIGVLAVGGTLYLLTPGQSGVGGPGSTPSASPGPSAPAPTPYPTPTPTPTSTPDIPSLAGPLGDGRQIHTSTALADGRVLVAGGFDNKDLEMASAVLYDPATGRFRPTGSMADARGQHTATLLADGRVLITGGGPASWVHPGAYLASAELYDPKTGTFSPTGSMAAGREAHTATLLADGRVLVAGGDDRSDHATASAELYDPRTGTFSPTGSMVTARSFHTATLLADGRVLIAGGSATGWSCPGLCLASAEIYDPTTGIFTATGSMTDGRGFHTATLLADGRVLITGGSRDMGANLASAELYDPRTGTFSLTHPMADARMYHTATLLADGRVLVAGGGSDYVDRAFLAKAELYDPRTGTFSATGPMAEARTFHGATLLTDGRVLVTGGYGTLAPLATAELYNPRTGTFSPVGSGG